MCPRHRAPANSWLCGVRLWICLWDKGARPLAGSILQGLASAPMAWDKELPLLRSSIPSSAMCPGPRTWEQSSGYDLGGMLSTNLVCGEAATSFPARTSSPTARGVRARA